MFLENMPFSFSSSLHPRITLKSKEVFFDFTVIEESNDSTIIFYSEFCELECSILRIIVHIPIF